MLADANQGDDDMPSIQAKMISGMFKLIGIAELISEKGNTI
jgi:hypothetical protein